MAFCRANDLDKALADTMRSVGFERLLIGIECSDPEILRLFKKGETTETIRQAIRILSESRISLIPGFMIFNPYTTLETLQVDLAFLREYGFTPVLSKALRVFDGTPIQRILENEGRLIWRNPFEGYHEYTVDPRVAAIYMSLKTLYVEWIDPFKKKYQTEIWGIKKAPAFTERHLYDSLSARFFDFEAYMLEALLSWSATGASATDVQSCLRVAKEKLLATEQLIASASASKAKFVRRYSTRDMARVIKATLTRRPFFSFPERYRWADD